MRSVMEIMRGHPVLYGLILAASILEGLMLYEGLQGYEDAVGPVWLKWFYVGFTAVLSCLVVTLWREERGGTRLWQEALGGLAGIVVGFGICLLDSAPGMEIFGVCAGLVLVFLFLYSGRRENNLLSVLTKNLLFSLASGLAVQLGLLLVQMAVNYLIVEMPDSMNEAFFAFSCSLSSLVSAGMMTALLFRKERVTSSGRGFRVFVLRVLFPLYVALLVVLYLYLLKILVLRTMPVGQINWFVSYACAVFMFFYFVLEEFQQERLVALFRRWGAVLILPLIAVQAVAVAIRISAYGLTTSRWYGLLFMGFSAIFMVTTLVRQGQYRRLSFLLLAALVVVSTLTPLKGTRVALWNQQRRIQPILTRYQVETPHDLEQAVAQMNEEELHSLSSSLFYLGRLTNEWDMDLYRLGAYDKAYWVCYDVIEEELERREEQEPLVQDGMETPEEDTTIDNRKFFSYRNECDFEQDISQYDNMVILYDFFETDVADRQQTILLPVDAAGHSVVDVTDFLFERLKKREHGTNYYVTDTDYGLILNQDGFRIVFLRIEVDWGQLVEDGQVACEGFYRGEFSYMVLW